MLLFLNIIIQIFLIKNCFSLERPKFYRCGFDDEKVEPIILKGYKPVNKTSNLYKRRLDSDGFKDFNIYLDVKNVENDIKLNGLDSYHDLFINSMKKAVETIQALLKVRPLDKEYLFTDDHIKALNIKEWDRSKIGDAANLKGVTMNSLGIDLIILGTIETLEGSTLASASAQYSQNDGKPLIGLVKINKEVDYSKEKSQEYFQAIVFHEFTHILGFSINNFKKFYHNVFTKEDDFGVMRTYINSPKVVETARKYFNCPDLEGVELEEYGGEGTAGSHWEARILLGDYMNGYAYTEEMVISEFTLALLEDTGYYKANYYTGGLMRYGKNKGCEFVRKQCVNKETHKINPLFYNEFFDTISDGKTMESSCSPGRQSRTYSAFWIYDEIPVEYQYFGSETVGGYSPADFCPIPIKYSAEEEKTNFAGHCSIKGSGEYGSQLVYESEYISPLSKNMIPVTGESLTDHSFCFLSSLTKINLLISKVYSSVVRAVCYEIFCSSKSLTVKIHEDYIVCPKTGGKINAEGYDGYFLCPDYNLICSGSVVCNDIFDCVDKKSVTKENTYMNADYTPKTSQNIEEANLSKLDEDNYELSEDGICPISCKQCKEKNKCFKCRNGFALEAIISENKIICRNESELEGYYIDENDIHYKCIENCEICSNYTGCDKCLRGYGLSGEKCIQQDNIIRNCLEYDINETCIRCVKNFAFKEDNKSICLNIENFEYYYTKDGGISYYPCDIENPNCSKCYFKDEENTTKCFLCKSGLVLLNREEGEKCYSKNIVANESNYVFINDTHIDLCEKVIPNCVECENNRKCKKCKDEYYFNNYDNQCLYKENVTKNYPRGNNMNDTTKQAIENNNSIFLYIESIRKISMVILLFLL